ncbi:hypothetical protein [Nocardia salmonicida]|uniref:hypothetical protein n=1 Tax=Nocardia salmonicida TaxID=53431 RepID=UPI0007A42881|nr:hypothetical protein [Nocardia salmonicida]
MRVLHRFPVEALIGELVSFLIRRAGMAFIILRFGQLMLQQDDIVRGCSAEGHPHPGFGDIGVRVVSPIFDPDVITVVVGNAQRMLFSEEMIFDSLQLCPVESHGAIVPRHIGECCDHSVDVSVSTADVVVNVVGPGILCLCVVGIAWPSGTTCLDIR